MKGRPPLQPRLERVERALGAIYRCLAAVPLPDNAMGRRAQDAIDDLYRDVQQMRQDANEKAA